MRLAANEKADSLGVRLREGSVALGVSLPSDKTTQLMSYLDQLARWNKTFNLTAVRDPGDMIDRHLLDSLAVVPLIKRTFGDQPIHLVDVGTGAGLPGIPIALVRPGTKLTLIETNGKKAAFLRQCQIHLGLADVQICQARVEDLQPSTLQFGRPDLIIARAFRAVGEFFELVAPLVSPSTTIFAMKGPALASELDQLDQQIQCNRVSKCLQSILASHHLTIEGLELGDLGLLRQVAILRAPILPDIRPSAVISQE